MKKTIHETITNGSRLPCHNSITTKCPVNKISVIGMATNGIAIKRAPKGLDATSFNEPGLCMW